MPSSYVSGDIIYNLLKTNLSNKNVWTGNQSCLRFTKKRLKIQKSENRLSISFEQMFKRSEAAKTDR